MRNVTTRPNVIVFLTDQQRWDTSGLFGNPLELTPQFDRFAQAGTFLPLSFTCQPVCAPARASLQTGLYATSHRVITNLTLPLDMSRPMLAKLFGAAGYRTGYIGKWHLADHKVPGPVPVAHRGGYKFWLAANIPEFTSQPYETIVYDGDGKETLLPGYRSDAFVDAAIRFVQQHRAEPFFLFVSIVEPHHQNYVYDYVPPDGYRERYTGRWTPPDLARLVGTAPQHLGGYWGAVKRVDEGFGRLLDALKSLKLRDNTILLYTSDHGCHFETRIGIDKRSCHESSIRVPTAFAGPGFDNAGRIAGLVSHVDLPPTLLEAAGLSVPASMQGRSISPLVGGRTVDDWPDDVLIQISESHVGRALRTKRWKYAVAAPGTENAGWAAGAERYVESELYDLEFNPYELANLIGFDSHRELADRLRARLIRRMVAAGEQAPIIDLALPPPSGLRVQRLVRPEELP